MLIKLPISMDIKDMKKLLFAVSIIMFSLLGLHTYAADAATTHGLKSNHMRNMDPRHEETMPATDDSTKPVTKEKKVAHKKTISHKKTGKPSKHNKHTSKKEEQK
ncbi:MAG: hypothetical protein HC877_01315 [Thioploca sp.]|nr:hypothetical protein [Thioploca sp.]